MGKKDAVMDSLFSVVLATYRQLNMLPGAILSVLRQDIKQLELVVSDDGTPGFSVEEIEAFIEKNKRSNLVSYAVCTREVNVGTVRNLNAAYARCRGQYITQFAADDRFHDTGVLKAYRAALDASADDVCGIYGRSLRCDENLVYRDGGEFIDPTFAKHMDTMTALQQFERFSNYCHVHMGATAFLRARFDRYGPFSEDYRLLEDWPFFARVTQEGGRFTSCDVIAIDYRSGGTSQEKVLSCAKKQCLRDTARMMQKEIWPYAGRLSPESFFWFCQKLDYLQPEFRQSNPGFRHRRRFTFFLKNPEGAKMYFDYHAGHARARYPTRTLYIKWFLLFLFGQKEGMEQDV